MGYVIAISQSKGGSTKTTTAINLCGALIEKGFKAIVADMDKDKPDALKWARQSEHINFVVELFDDKPMEKLDQLKREYDFILLDTPPNYMPAAFKAIIMSNFIILPCSPSFLDQNNLIDAISVPRMAQKPYKILGCKINKTHKVSQKLMSELIKSGQAFETYITNKSAVLESPFQGKWLGQERPGSPSHKEFLSLALEVIRIARVLPEVKNEPTLRTSTGLDQRVNPR